MPGRVIDAAAAGKALIIGSVPLLDELQGVLSRRKFTGQLAKLNANADDLFDGYAALVRLVAPSAIGSVILADPDDDIVLATAVGGSADAIVSGDAHLLGDRRVSGYSHHHACGGRESAGGVTDTSDVARWHFRVSGTTILRGIAALPMVACSGWLMASHGSPDLPSLAPAPRRSSTARAGMALCRQRHRATVG